MSLRTKFATGLLAAAVLVVSGCGNDSNAPVGSQITFSRTDISLNVADASAGGTLPCTVQYTDTPINISILDQDNNPLGKIELTINLSFAPNSSSPGLLVMELYDDANGDGRGDVLVEVPFVDETEEDGIKRVVVRLYAGCGLSYSGQLGADSGIISNVMDITVGT
ncbi:MAG: hypothetical protein BMS9Abin36_0082 [Gammaproteobacteria bacterium]|nr:MAG: hypothetical protein BMS9Abin36_0082 [Gammaproteobacteria bacterium]